MQSKVFFIFQLQEGEITAMLQLFSTLFFVTVVVWLIVMVVTKLEVPVDVSIPYLFPKKFICPDPPGPKLYLFAT